MADTTVDKASAGAGDLPPFRPLPFKAPDMEVTRKADGTIYLVSRTPVPPAPQSIPHLLDEKAALHPDRPFMRQRPPGGGAWRTVTYGEAAQMTRGLAQALLDRGLGPDAPVMILSPNSIEHGLIALAAQRIGAPAAPVSPAYSLMSSDFAKLKHCFAAVRPKAVFVQAIEPFKRALGALDLAGVSVISADGSNEAESIQALIQTPASIAVDLAQDALTPGTVGKYLFTSGSTGLPKATPQTQGAMTAQVACRRAIDAPAPDADPNEVQEILDWMPWSHIAGGNVNFHGALMEGAIFHIDDGRPLPGMFQATIDNVRDVRPQYYGSAPVAFSMLAEAMEADTSLRDAFFSRMQFIAYGGATLSDDLYGRLQALSIASTGYRIPIMTMYGATETQGVTMVHWQIEKVGMIGLPLPGLTMKLVPNGEKLEVRIKGPTVMSGYLDMPEKNREVFDEEGYYCLGDAARFEDPDRPDAGLVFDGRVTEDFKLDNGTWVSVGTLRPDVIAACAPLVFDAVICGQDKPYVAALVWPSPAAAKSAIEAAGGDMMAGLKSLVGGIAAKLAAYNASAGGSSRRIARFSVLTTPPSLDAGEITDKGYVNQRAAQAARATEVAALFADEPPPGVVVL
ncbi:AMP-binding protein [bacterium]|nr:AMP-binding protein [bacterium]